MEDFLWPLFWIVVVITWAFGDDISNMASKGCYDIKTVNEMVYKVNKCSGVIKKIDTEKLEIIKEKKKIKDGTWENQNE